MATNELHKALEMEIAMRKEEVKNLLQQCESLIAELRSGRSLNHGAFNLAARCQDLAVLAGQIEQSEKILRSL